MSHPARTEGLVNMYVVLQAKHHSWDQQSLHQMMIGVGYDFDTNMSLPLTQSMPAISYNTTRLYWFPIGS